MAPLKGKINHTLHKINDKIKRHSSRVDQPADKDAAHTKQLRALQPLGFHLPPSSSSSSGQGSASFAPQQPGAGVPSGHDGARGYHPFPQLPATSASGSGSANSVHSTLPYGFGPPPPAGSVMSVDWPEPKHAAVVMQSSAATPFPPGSFANPIANSSQRDPRTTVDLTFETPASNPQGQKRFWTEPTPPDPMDVDTVGQKTKMPRSAHYPSSSFLTTGPLSLPSRYPTRASSTHGQQNNSSGGDLLTPWANTLNTELHVPKTGYPSDDDFVAFRARVLGAQCRVCQMPLVSSMDKITSRTRTTLTDKHQVLHPFLTCERCKTVSCVGCRRLGGSQVVANLPFRKKTQWSNVAWCCDDGRLFLIWALCCGPEDPKFNSVTGLPLISRLFSAGRPKAPKPEGSTPSPAKAKEKALPRALSKGVGYGSDEYILHAHAAAANASAAAVHAAAQAQMQSDPGFFLSSGNQPTPEEKALPGYFIALQTLLSTFPVSPESALLKDNPLGIIKLMLKRSPLLPKAAELLRNDSMEDIANLRHLYEPLMGLIRTISSQDDLLSVVFDGYTLYPVEEQLVYFSSSKGDSNEGSLASGGKSSQRGKAKQPEQGTPIANIVLGLANMCGYLNRAAQDKAEFTVGGSADMLALSRLICDVAFENEAKRQFWSGAEGGGSASSQPMGQTHGAANVVTRSRGAEKARDDLRDLHSRASVALVDDQTMLVNFKFAVEASRLGVGLPAPGRMRKLLSQVAMLRTALPDNIWVRHGSSRPDMIKFLVTGPKGTPYENGLFEFDLFCPIDFPTKPPVAHFRTTGGGRVRFNPNLYEDGKVCLSLLGTWAGPTWNGAYSTLSQILVSIQSMIFTDEPWYNEPGRELHPSKTHSKRYNQQIQAYTVEYAMADWLINRLAPPPGVKLNLHQGTPVPPPANSGVFPPPPPPAPALNPHLLMPSSSIPHYLSPHVGSIFGGPQPHQQQASAMPNMMMGIPAYKKPAQQAQAPAVPSAPAVDDAIWGDIVRKHFAANGKAIVDRVKGWKLSTKAGQDAVGRLTDALVGHGFL